MTDWVAELEVFFECAGTSTPGVIRIGQPWVAEAGVEAKCRVCLDGLAEELPAVSGSDPLQALLLALRLAALELARYQNAGGRVCLRDGAEVGCEIPLDAYFGSLLEAGR